MNENSSHDAIIVGAGPAGSSCAAMLGRAGLSTLLVEKETFPREKVCGCCLNPGVWPMLEYLGAAAAVRSSPHRRIEAVRLVSWKGRASRREIAPRLKGKFIAIRRSILDTILARNAEN